ncbi:UDP-3-O-(3-hydroxymyristoyl)glucosamine N-acyltransferase [Flavobacterium sp.]|uniref:UDP-3-O-(3-hydroxymyristoyl)glucosamine N-acyltransferase n=1 Tax=Flavobacterium sp. TaxID=239 RepID=UPI002EDA8B48
MKKFSVHEICTHLHGITDGKTSARVSSAGSPETAQPHQITFIGNKKFERLWPKSKALVAVVDKNSVLDPGPGRALIKVDSVELAMCRVLELFRPAAVRFENNIHHSAVIHKSAEIGDQTKIGAGVYVGAGCKLEHNVTIYPNVTVLDGCFIGSGTVIWPGTVIRENCRIGLRTIIHSNAVIGADGFGFVKCPVEGLVKVPHIGNVVIGDDVEIGAGVCIDRAKFASTVIGNGCKIDNLVQIGHNCIVGEHCIIAGNSGLAGSVKLGRGVVIGGGSSIKDHVTLGDGATVGGGSGVISDVSPGDTVLGYPALKAAVTLKHWASIKEKKSNPIV